MELGAGGKITARSLFVAALRMGPSYPSVGWLYDWLVHESSKAAVQELIEQYQPSSASDAVYVPLSTHAEQVFERARRFAQQTGMHGAYDARHLLAALTLP